MSNKKVDFEHLLAQESNYEEDNEGFDVEEDNEGIRSTAKSVNKKEQVEEDQEESKAQKREEEELENEKRKDFWAKHPTRTKEVGPRQGDDGFDPWGYITARISRAMNSSNDDDEQDGNNNNNNNTRTLQEITALQIGMLPCTAKYFFKIAPTSITTSLGLRGDVNQERKENRNNSDEANQSFVGWSPSLRVILCGTRCVKRRNDDNDDNRSPFSSPLALLRQHESTIIRHIFSFLFDPLEYVKITIPADLVAKTWGDRLMRFVHGRGPSTFHMNTKEDRPHLVSSIPPQHWELKKNSNDTNTALFPCKNNNFGIPKSTLLADAYVAFAKVGDVLDLFPPPQSRNVNMMPFVLGDRKSLPDNLQCYYDLVDACPWVREERGKVAFLTVHETIGVSAGATQRRPGLHIESPGTFPDNAFDPAGEHPWGQGHFYHPRHRNNFDHYEGGIYIASNVDNTTALWDALVDRSIPGMVDRTGGCEYLRPVLPESRATKLQAGELVWMTDCTPHEALPQTQRGPRTFFRLVMPNVSHWYAAHSTPNPKVPLPAGIKVIAENKFAAI